MWILRRDVQGRTGQKARRVEPWHDFRRVRWLRLGGWVQIALLTVNCLSPSLLAQNAFNWREILDKFKAANPTLKAAQLNIDESRAAEITAYLRPNPSFTLSTDGTQLSRYQGVWRPLAGTQVSPGVSYLHEREHKRELRRDSAR
jgi:cobalt-zinc-cadmium efflux system outer membrane protein